MFFMLIFTITSYAEPQIIMDGQYVIPSYTYIEDIPPIDNISEVLDSYDEVYNPEIEYIGDFKLTFYCPCRKCNGKWGAIDRYGNPLVWGTIAVDPKVIPLQTQVKIEGYGDIFTARDTGGKWVQGNHIDVFVPVSHSQALNMPQGTRRKVWLVK